MIKVLVVDDSAIVRNKLTHELNKYPDIQVVGTAMNPYIARDKIVELNPDVITLDVEMPRMDGITFLKKLMRFYPKPVIMISSLTKKGSEIALEALHSGAVEVMCKPGGSYSVGDLSAQLAHVIRASASADLKTKNTLLQHSRSEETERIAQISRSSKLNYKPDTIIALGASTGGTEALTTLLKSMPSDTPGTVIVQHMPAHFTEAFANRINKICDIEIREAKDGDEVKPGVALLAPGNYHMVMVKRGAQYFVKIKEGPKVHHQRPAVDVLFQSVVKCNPTNIVAAVLTGMGKDGALGLKNLRDIGAKTIAQDEKTSVVFGMPKEAINLGGAEHVLPLQAIGPKILDLASK